MESTRRLACKRCQTRKIKCNRVQPCAHCVQANHVCEFRTNDGRRRPVSHKYLSALETRLAWFESLTQELKKASNDERDELLAGVSLDDHLESRGETEDALIDNNSPAASETSINSHTVSLRSGPQGALQFHGPTSIYLDAGSTDPMIDERGPTAIPRGGNASTPFAPDAFSILRLASALGVDDVLIRETLALFFLHQYPLCMFIYREAFLSDYYDNTYGGRYWSYPLLYSMCALGAPHSHSAKIQAKNHVLARSAQEMIISHCLTNPSPTTIQALLCLAFHEVGQGNASQGWLFSGMAFRMGQDIGFHQDPTRWVLQDRSIVTPEDIEIRRRIYWGSYAADKFISLYLGRPVYLREDDAAVHPSARLPDFPSNHAWFGLSEIASQNAGPDLQKPQFTSALKHIVLLGKIFQDMMADIFSSARNTQRNENHRLNRLGDLNVRLNKWQTSLPDSLQWSQWSVNKNAHANVLVLHMFYHSLLLSLNRHFVKPSSGFPQSTSSSEICASSSSIITSLIRQFRIQHGLNSAPLMLVYALVMAIITQKQTLDQGREGVSFLFRALEECSQYYKLAAEARSRFNSPLASSTASFTTTANTFGTANTPTIPLASGDEQNPEQAGVSTDPTFDPLILDSNAQSGIFNDGFTTDDLISMNSFDVSGFGDVNGDFHSWFSIGHMG
ncbi:fungal-specific transcription factor domain-containing protein [Dendryphion nanum]|uniref:Fungal-specific transcription factor domain-containing protein n=1 Tax=Dendryphion nanum TaxID=256645 RepID=A0A9P9CYC5_9PLEO|nr:fungal-specific transcription factor domain-containing protein [Dendryphion nanum]